MAASASARSPAVDELVRRHDGIMQDAIYATRFPPNSQPLRKDMLDLIHPNRRYESPHPVFAVGSGANGATDPSNDFYVLFTGPSMAIAPGQPAIATLQVFQGANNQSNPVAVSIQSLRLLKFAQPNFLPVNASLTMQDDGQNNDAQANDNIYTCSFVPTSIPDLQSFNGQVRLEVTFSVPGSDKPGKAALVFMVGSQAPATFTGQTTEQMGSQGLTISTVVQVTNPGSFFVQGLLFDANDTPIGYAIDRETWTAGPQLANFLFFGLLFHEAKAVSPYHFKTLTGYRLPDPGDPHQQMIPEWDGDYQTKAYNLNDFSTSEWDSPQRNQQLNNVANFASAQPTGDPLPPPPSSMVAIPAAPASAH